MGRADDRSHTMHVSGTGSVELIPDGALFPWVSTPGGEAIPELQRETDTRVTELLSVFGELGLPDADMQATDLRIAPRYRYDKSLQQSVPDGFEVSRELRITLRDLSLLGRVMTAATEAGVNNISPPQLSSSIHEEKYREALTLAVSHLGTGPGFDRRCSGEPGARYYHGRAGGTASAGTDGYDNEGSGGG